MKKAAAIVVVLAFALSLMACSGASQQEKKTAQGALIGAGLGALAGQAIGRNTQGTLIGAGVGAALGGLAGNRIGAYMDSQEQELRGAVASTEAASIQRSQDVLTATFRSDVLFDTNSANLKPGAYPEIDRVANVLVQYPQTRISVQGHTDTRGDENYNLRLSERRAEAVKNALAQRGVDPVRIQTIGYGETQPISSNDDLNRRVVVVITPIRQG